MGRSINYADANCHVDRDYAAQLPSIYRQAQPGMFRSRLCRERIGNLRHHRGAWLERGRQQRTCEGSGKV